MGAYEVILAPSVLAVMEDMQSKDDRRRVRNRLEALAVMPRLGEVYDPAYESARPPHQVLVTFAGHYGIYYSLNEDAQEVWVEFVEDCRRDPLK